MKKKNICEKIFMCRFTGSMTSVRTSTATATLGGIAAGNEYDDVNDEVDDMPTAAGSLTS